MRKIYLIILIFVNLLYAQEKNIAIFDFNLENINFNQYLNFRKELYSQLKKNNQYKVMDENIMRSIMNTLNITSDCFTDKCLIDKSSKLGVDLVISGSLKKIGNKTDIDIIVIDAINQKITNRYSQTYNSDLNFITNNQISSILLNLFPTNKILNSKIDQNSNPPQETVTEKTDLLKTKVYTLKPKEIKTIQFFNSNINKQDLTYTIINPSIAMISEDWRILAISPGNTKAVITNNNNNIIDTLTIIVHKTNTIKKENINFNQNNITKHAHYKSQNFPRKKTTSKQKTIAPSTKNPTNINNSPFMYIAKIQGGTMAQYYGPSINLGGSFGVIKKDSKLYIGASVNGGSSIVKFYYSQNMHGGAGLDILYSIIKNSSNNIQIGTQLGYYYFQTKYYNEEKTDYSLKKFDYIGGPELQYDMDLNGGNISFNTLLLIGASQERTSFNDALKKISIAINCNIGYSFFINK